MRLLFVKKYILALGGGLIIIAVALIATSLPEKGRGLTSNQWTMYAGVGLIAPACGSSVPSVTCQSDGLAQATIQYGLLDSCFSSVSVNLNSGVSQSGGCSGGAPTFTGLLPNTPYSYGITYEAAVVSGKNYIYVTHTNPTGSFTTPNCSAIVPPPPSTTPTIGASPATIPTGGSTTITWDGGDGAVQCTGTNFTTGNAPSGSVPVSPSDTTTYSIDCSNGGGASVTVTVLPSSASLTADPARVHSGSTSSLTWTSSGATSCLLTGLGVNKTGLSGTTPTPAITTNQIYTLTCQTPKGPVTSQATVGPLPVFQQI